MNEKNVFEPMFALQSERNDKIKVTAHTWAIFFPKNRIF